MNNRIHRRIAAWPSALLYLCAAAALAQTPGPCDVAQQVNFNIATPVFTQAYNDRIGNSRFFGGPNTDRLRVSAFVSPSPDSDVFQGSTNGACTTVSITHPDMGAIASPRELTFVGLTSARGGGRNEYTTSFDLAHSLVQPLIPAWDAAPFVVTVRNPLAPAVQSIVTATPDFDPNALPPFVSDLSVTAGTAPRLDWRVPAGPIVPTSSVIQVRRIESESGDRSRITGATLVHSQRLPVATTSATISQFCLDGTGGCLAPPPGQPTGFEQGRRYEIAVMLEIAAGGNVKGRSRTFFEYTPLDEATGVGSVAVYLPSVGPSGEWKFDIAVTQGEPVAIDPEIAIGYDYAIGAGDPLFASVRLPNVGDGRYALQLYDGASYVFAATLTAGETYAFPGAGVDRFRVLGIEPSAGLDRLDTTAFVTTLTFATSGRFTGTMTPLTRREIAIDIRPGGEPGSVNPRSRGVIAVAILSAGGLDVTDVDVATLKFGRSGDEDSLSGCGYERIDADDAYDLVCRFRTPATGFAAGDTMGILKGALRDGTPIVGEGAVTLRP